MFQALHTTGTPCLLSTMVTWPQQMCGQYLFVLEYVHSIVSSAVVRLVTHGTCLVKTAHCKYQCVSGYC